MVNVVAIATDDEVAEADNVIVKVVERVSRGAENSWW